MTQEVGSQKHKEQMQMWTAYEQMVTQQCYLEVLTRLWASVWRKRPELWPDSWILCHDNAPAHDALRFHKFLAKKSITKTDHQLYSPDLAPCNFWLFPKLKNADIHCNMTLL
jgi:hypothetical protein